MNKEQVAQIMQTVNEMLIDRDYEITHANIKEEGFLIEGEHNIRRRDGRREGIIVKQVKKYDSTVRTEIQNQSNLRVVLVVEGRQPAQNELLTLKGLNDNVHHLIVEVIPAERLLFNVTKHVLVPKHKVLTEAEKIQVLTEIKATEGQLQTIEPSDPVAMYFGMQEGDVVLITRISETAGKYINYRICIEK